MWCLFGFCFFLKLTSYLEHFFTKILLGKNIIYSGVYQKNQQLNKRKRNTKTSSVKKYLAISWVADTWDIGNRTCRWNRYVSTNIFFLYTGVQVQWLELAVETKRFIVTPKKYPPHRFCWCWKCKVVCWRQLMTWFIARAVPKVQCIERSSAAVFQWFYFLMEGNKLTMNSYTAKKYDKNKFRYKMWAKMAPISWKYMCVWQVWTGRDAEGKRLPAQVLCQELASWQEFSARKQVPGRNFLRGSRFLAGSLCQEAGSWQKFCAGKHFLAFFGSEIILTWVKEKHIFGKCGRIGFGFHALSRGGALVLSSRFRTFCIYTNTEIK